MIKLESVNKYFNRYRKNQIHVINNATINFPETGLVALLGPSGSGKTTLLNAIGGLDKVSSGNIYVNGMKITKKSSYKVDKIRNLNIGYIFQDYKLVDHLSVYDNVALSLKLIGIKDKSEIEKRVLYVLDKVGLKRFKNRPASMLSGGERQRVGIARALVKNPKIIIADEPTGNLDSRVSLEIMNIIKSISNNTLVILVTHEEELARFYASTIVELKDGTITNVYDNKDTSSLDYEIENHIYLKDYKDIKKINKDNVNINIYRNNNEPLDINIVFKNGNIYVNSKTEEKLEVVENNSHIELIDDHYKKIKQQENDNLDFDMNKVSNQNLKTSYSSIFHLASFIPYGFKKVINYPVLKKILLGGFFLSGMFIFYSVSSIFATLNIKDEDFITMNKDYLITPVKNVKVDDYLALENNELIDYILPSNSLINLKIHYDKYLQTSYSDSNISASLSDINTLNKDSLIIGRMPEENLEIVIDKMVLTNFIDNNMYATEAGFSKIEDYLNHDVTLQNNLTLTIVGISNNNEPNMYASKDMFINIIANNNPDDMGIENINNYSDYTLYLDKYVKLTKGRLPSNDYEILVNNNLSYEMPLNKNIDTKINNHKLKVVGYYENITDTFYNTYLTNSNTIKYDLINNASNLTIYSKNKDKALTFMQNNKYNIKDSYHYAKDNYLKLKKESMVSTLILSGIILGVSLIEIILMIRSSFLSRIKEVGIYRAIGLKKSDIYKMFAGEILAITTIASILGISFMTYILYSVSSIEFIKNLFMVNIFTYLISIILVYVFNLFFGLLPVFNTIRKTPAQILARFDVD